MVQFVLGLVSIAQATKLGYAVIPMLGQHPSFCFGLSLLGCVALVGLVRSPGGVPGLVSGLGCVALSGWCGCLWVVGLFGCLALFGWLALFGCLALSGCLARLVLLVGLFGVGCWAVFWSVCLFGFGVLCCVCVCVVGSSCLGSSVGRCVYHLGYRIHTYLHPLLYG